MDAIPRLIAADPTRTPDWRWQRAQMLICLGDRPTPRSDDESTREAYTYLAAQYPCSSRSRPRTPDCWDLIRAALALHHEHSARRWEADARLLAGEHPADVAGRTSIDHQILCLYETLFFDVRRFLTARDWIAGSVLGGAWLGLGGASLGDIWRAVGYYGGVVALETVMRATKDGSSSETMRGALSEADVDRNAVLLLACRQLPATLGVEQLADLHLRAAQVRSSDAFSASMDHLEEFLAELQRLNSLADLPKVSMLAPATAS